MTRDEFDYSHGDTGNKPQSPLDFQKNQRPKAQNFDWWWYSVIQAINGHADEFHRLDNNDDGIVDEADYAQNAGALQGKTFSDFTKETNSASKSGNKEFKHIKKRVSSIDANGGSRTVTTKVNNVDTDEVLFRLFANQGSSYYEYNAEIYLDGVKHGETTESRTYNEIESNYLIPMDNYNEIEIKWNLSWGDLSTSNDGWLNINQSHTRPYLIPHTHSIDWF